MVKVNDLCMAFGSQLVFKDVKFNINSRERIGLIGRNGSGKTTLFNLLNGTLTPDHGTIILPKNYRIGYVKQQLAFTEETVILEGCKGLLPEHKDESWRVEKVLSGLGFTKREMEKNPGLLSGGYQVRLNLVKELVNDPDLLLLDEPTNYLDIVSIRWLGNYLCSWPKELMLVTHDRSFMDSVISHTMIIHRKRIRKIIGNTEKMYQQILKEEEIYEKTRLNNEKKRKDMEIFINRFRAKARLAGLVQSRIKTLKKREHFEKLEKLDSLDFSFNAAPFPAKYLLSAKNLSFSYSSENPYLIDNFSVTVSINDRIAIIGQNGRGKSTLLRLLYGELKPVTGSIESHQSTSIGYFGQTNIDRLHKDKSIEQELYDSDPFHNKKKVMNICGAMLFGGELAQKKIGVLSGGERSRVLLGKILLSPTNLLLLDEPANHLDMESSDSFMSAVDLFPGAVMLVTHNEVFLHTLVKRLIVFDKGVVSLFEGSYQDFLDKTGWEHERYTGGIWNDQRTIMPSAKAEEFPKHQSNRNESRKLKAKIVAQRAKSLKPIKESIHRTERLIEACETELNKYNRSIIRASEKGEGERISELSIIIHDLKSKINVLYSELEEILEEQKEQEEFFELRLRDL